MDKRGATVLNMIMVFGLMVIGVIAISSLRSVILSQAKVSEQEYYDDFAENILSVIEQIESYQNDVNLSVNLILNNDYIIEVSNNELILTTFNPDLKITKYYPAWNINVLPSKLESQGTIKFYLKNKNLLITDNKKCNLNDNICDPFCTIEDKCDDACYHEYENNICSLSCIDLNKDRTIDYNDIDGICDPDCYDSFRNGGIYDPDCVISDDNICEPDSHLVYDSICDSDCRGTNGVCDPDCGMDDIDCPHEKNGNCECDLGENCETSPEDCSCSEGFCRYSCSFLTEYINKSGCVEKIYLRDKGDQCINSCECSRELFCDTSGHCCPENMIYRDGECTKLDVWELQSAEKNLQDYLPVDQQEIELDQENEIVDKEDQDSGTTDSKNTDSSDSSLDSSIKSRSDDSDSREVDEKYIEIKEPDAKIIQENKNQEKNKINTEKTEEDSLSKTTAVSDKKKICGNNICEKTETNLDCPEDCPSSLKDNICNDNIDGICDPDCIDKDRDCIKTEQSLNKGSGFKHVIFILIIIAILILIIIKTYFKKKDV
ncbi:hypothetical protein GF327_08680 [Candidatus Woesearchaeota archaeon]|nr:hypothetical protein [Candidatus Woesearchaeota archaeon]